MKKRYETNVSKRNTCKLSTLHFNVFKASGEIILHRVERLLSLEILFPSYFYLSNLNFYSFMWLFGFWIYSSFFLYIHIIWWNIFFKKEMCHQHFLVIISFFSAKKIVVFRKFIWNLPLFLTSSNLSSKVKIK